MQKIAWYKKEIQKELMSQSFWFIFSIFFFLGTVFAWKFLSYEYEFKTIDTTSVPIWSWALYSALTFIGPGAILYRLGFYQKAYSFFKQVFGSHKGYALFKDFKKIIWGLLILLMFLVVIPLFIKFINLIIIISLNILGIFIYSTPIFLTVFIGFLSYKLFSRLYPA